MLLSLASAKRVRNLRCVFSWTEAWGTHEKPHDCEGSYSDFDRNAAAIATSTSIGLNGHGR